MPKIKKENDMKRSLITLATITTFGLLTAGPIMANQSDNDINANGQTEVQMFQAAAISLQQASDLALKEISGSLAEIGFNDENGIGVYEATIIGTDGTESIVKIDANTGATLGKGLAYVMDEEDDGGDNENGEGGAEREDGND
jgi:uncharacterized membrane protein YkoI